MNAIRATQNLNARELAAGTAPSASWHRDFADTAYIYIGGLPFTLSEGDIITIFSQFGEPVHVNLVRDKETGKSKGFAFLKYEDQRSTDLAVDNLGGATVMGRLLRVDHTRYKKREGEEEGAEAEVGGGGGQVGREGDGRRRERSISSEKRPLLKEELQLAKLLQDHDDDDPMREYLIQEKRDQVAAAIKEYESTILRGDKKSPKEDKSRHSHRHRHHSDRHRDVDSTHRAHRSSRPHRSRERSPAADSEDSERERRRRKRRDEDNTERYRSRR